MVSINKINLATGENTEVALFSGNELQSSLIAFLEQELNKNFGTWNYENSKFSNKITSSKANPGKTIYYMIDDNQGYMAKLQ